MKKELQLAPQVFALRSLDPQRKLFDELIPLPDGTSYNAYLVQGSEKTALIDSADPAKTHILNQYLDELNIESIDYLVANHAEQDHSGSLPALLERFPDAQVVTNNKCQNMLMDLLHIDESKFLTISDQQTLSLGDKTLQFIFTPWVHWPETMVTYLQEDNILFSCDLFGSHLADEELFAQEGGRLYEAAKRYYAEIMMPFRGIVKTNMDKLAKLKIDFIAPSHGPVYDDPQLILTAYQDWISDQTQDLVIIGYVSMHGSTAIMAEHLSKQLKDMSVPTKIINLTEADLGQVAVELVDANTVILATPTVIAGPHPVAVYVTYLLNILKPKVKNIGIIGSYGWGGRTVDFIQQMLTNIKPHILEPVLIKGLPRDSDMQQLDHLAQTISNIHHNQFNSTKEKK